MFTLAVGEFAVSRLLHAQQLMRFEQLGDAFEGHHEGRLIDTIFENDPELFWHLTPNMVLADDEWPLFGVISNASGLREDHEIPIAREDPSEIRILFLGDSTTFGYLLSDSQTFVQATEDQLQVRFPDSRIECINAGVPGYSLFQGWRFLETAGVAYEPDLVIVGFGWNDSTQWDGLGDAEHHELIRKQQPPALLKWSRIARMAGTVLHPRPVAASPSRPRLLPAEFRDLLEKMQLTSREHGAEFLVLIGTARFNIDGSTLSYRTRLQLEQYSFGAGFQFGPGHATGIIDTVPIVQQLAKDHTTEELFFDHVHPTAVVNERIGQVIAEKIDPWVEDRILRKRIETEAPPIGSL